MDNIAALHARIVELERQNQHLRDQLTKLKVYKLIQEQQDLSLEAVTAPIVTILIAGSSWEECVWKG
jgi:cytochrome P450